MKQLIKNAPISARIGTEFAAGLANQAPKEMEHYRKSSGLKALTEEADKLSPLELQTKLSSIYGISPEEHRQFAETARHQGRANAVIKEANEKKVQNQNTIRDIQKQNQNVNQTPSLTTQKATQETLENFIPPTPQQEQARGVELFTQNPARFDNDINKALDIARQETIRNQEINEAYQRRRNLEQDVQNRVETGLKHQSGLLNTKVPGNVYSDIEDEAIRSVLPKEKGGQGLTEQQAKKEYGKKLDEVSREYEDVKNIGNAAILFKNPAKTRKDMENLYKKFDKRGDNRNLKNLFISQNGLSPSKASLEAYPLKGEKKLYDEFKSIPKLETKTSVNKYGVPIDLNPPDYVDNKTLEVSRKLSKNLGEKGSILTVGEELKNLGYNPEVWFDYIRQNQDKLNLRAEQSEELNQTPSWIPNLNDIWLFMFTGKEKYVED